MAIADRIEKAILDLKIGDYENSLVQISIAIDATGKRRKSNSKVGERCREFINENCNFIFHFAIDGRIKVSNGGKITFGDHGDLGHALYKSVRCALLHEGDISSTVVFEKGFILGQRDNKLIITDCMLIGLILAIVGEPLNLREKMKQELAISYEGKAINVNEFWGKHGEIKKITDYIELA
jgi:hypothetical protein